LAFGCPYDPEIRCHLVDGGVTQNPPVIVLERKPVLGESFEVAARGRPVEPKRFCDHCWL
jgi:hypothetical protein